MRQLTERERYQLTRIRQLAVEVLEDDKRIAATDSEVISNAGLIAEYAKSLEAPILNKREFDKSPGALRDTRTMDGTGKLTDTRKP